MKVVLIVCGGSKFVPKLPIFRWHLQMIACGLQKLTQSMCQNMASSMKTILVFMSILLKGCYSCRYHLDLCKNVFGEGIYPEVDATNLYYGGKKITGKNIYLSLPIHMLLFQISNLPYLHAKCQFCHSVTHAC